MNELLPYLRLLTGYRGRLLVGLLLMMATTVAAVGLLALSGWFITATAVTAMLLAAGVQAQLGIYVPGAGIRFFAIARTAARYFERIQNHDTVLRLLAALRTRVFARLTPLDPATLARFRTARVLNRLTTDIDALDTLYLRCLAPPIVAVCAIIATGGLLAVFDPGAGMFPATVLLLGGVAVTLVTARPGRQLGEAVSRRLEQARTRVIELVQGLPEYRAFGTTAGQRDRIDREILALHAGQARTARIAAGGEAAMGLLVHAALALALWLGLHLEAQDTISGPVAVLLPLAVLALAEALGPVPGAFVQLGRARAAARRLNDQVRTPATIVDPARPTPPGPDHRLEIDRVTCRHAAGAEAVLRDLSLHIGDGESIAVTGPSGSGKSTLADLCCRLIEPERGEIRLGGTALADMALSDLHARVGYLTQRTELFADTIAANLRLARPEADADALWGALEVVDLGDFVDTLDEGLDTWVGEGGVRLSGGQARRLALARVILKEPAVALLDEPLAGLDRETATTVSRRLEPWLASRTALLLAHEHEALPPADRILSLAALHS